MSTTLEDVSPGQQAVELQPSAKLLRGPSLSNHIAGVSISRSVAAMCALLLVTILTDALLVFSLGLHFPVADAIRPLAIGTLLSAAALYYLRRREDSFVMCLQSLAIVVVFTAAYTVLMYSIAAIGWPLQDSALAGIDAWLGARTDRIREWAIARPLIAYPLAIAYDTVILQTAAVVIVLGFSKCRRELEGFVLAFMVTTLISAACFVVLPADGPFVTYSYQPNEAQVRFLRDFHAMRSGTRTVVTWRDAEGLITCPSFHTTWAILLAWAFRRHRLLRWPVAALNAAVVVSTMTTGWHYSADVLAGVMLAIAGIWLVTASDTWLYAQGGESRRWRPFAGLSDH